MPDRETYKHDSQDWLEYRRYILARIKDMEELKTTFNEYNRSMDQRLTKIETKAGMIGLVGGSIAGAVFSYVLTLL